MKQTDQPPTPSRDWRRSTPALPSPAGPRYDKPGLVPSEHAKGDAIDIGSFVLADGRRIPVKQQNSDIRLSTDLVHALRMTACGYFTTVLGPGSDTAHEEHLHFDSGMHGATPNYRICE